MQQSAPLACSASAPGFSDAAAGLDTPALMARIHARDAGGRWYHGIDVFELAYRAADLDRVAALWAHPCLRPLWAAACQAGVCPADGRPAP